MAVDLSQPTGGKTRWLLLWPMGRGGAKQPLLSEVVSQSGPVRLPSSSLTSSWSFLHLCLVRFYSLEMIVELLFTFQILNPLPENLP